MLALWRRKLEPGRMHYRTRNKRMRAEDERGGDIDLRVHAVKPAARAHDIHPCQHAREGQFETATIASGRPTHPPCTGRARSRTGRSCTGRSWRGLLRRPGRCREGRSIGPANESKGTVSSHDSRGMERSRGDEPQERRRLSHHMHPIPRQVVELNTHIQTLLAPLLGLARGAEPAFGALAPALLGVRAALARAARRRGRRRGGGRRRGLERGGARAVDAAEDGGLVLRAKVDGVSA